MATNVWADGVVAAAVGKLEGLGLTRDELLTLSEADIQSFSPYSHNACGSSEAQTCCEEGTSSN